MRLSREERQNYLDLIIFGCLVNLPYSLALKIAIELIKNKILPVA
jgi:hypothetical protein